MKTSHGYKEDVKESILAAALRDTEDYTGRALQSSAIAVMEVLLAAHRGYEKQVRKHVIKMHQNFPGLTFKELKRKVDAAVDYEEFKNVWGHKDKTKFATLKAMSDCILPWLGTRDTVQDDYAVMSEWAMSANLEGMNNDAIGRLKNVGIATFQYLRMTFGVDTAKPDQRVKDVLQRDFGWKVSQERAILIVERIAQILGKRTLFVDQVFVKYGSGHYTSEAKSVHTAEKEIVRRLKALDKLSVNEIADVTGWPLNEVQAA